MHRSTTFHWIAPQRVIHLEIMKPRATTILELIHTRGHHLLIMGDSKTKMLSRHTPRSVQMIITAPIRSLLATMHSYLDEPSRNRPSKAENL